MAIRIGSFFNDRLVGTNGNDRMFGLSGNDRISGRAGNDLIIGGRGNDLLDGGSGNDLLQGGRGNDLLDGGSGNDLLQGGRGSDRLFGGRGNDRLYGGSGNDLLNGGDGVDALWGGRGRDILIGGKGNDKVFGGSGDDLLIWNNGDGSDLMSGGSGYDTVRVNGADGPGDEFELSQANGKALFSRLNLGRFTLTNDSIEKFEINGQGGNDSLKVGDLAGSDVEKVKFSGGAGNDTLDARESSTAIAASGGDGDDLLLGGSAVDTFDAGAGDDIVVGQRGNDIAHLGEGRDRFVWNNGDGSDLINGGAGYDTTQVNGADGPGDQFELSQENGKALFNRVNLGLFTLTNDSIEQFEINGQAGDDSLVVGDLSDSGVEKVIFSGGEGNDTLDARESSTTIEAFGGDGDDLLLGGSAVDTFDAGAGDDIVVGQRGNDIARLGDGDDRFIWNNGDGSDRISGGAGFDVTQVNGAEAGDTFTLSQADGQAIFSRINLGLFTLTNDSIEQFEINGQGGDDSFTVGDLTGSDVQTVVFSGGDGNDFFNATGTFTPVVVDGGDGNDIILGGAGNDILIGGNGSDLLIGGGGNDILIGSDDAFRVGFDTGAAFDTNDIGIDTIRGFGAEAQIVLDTTVFDQLSSAVGGPLSADEFAVVNSAEEAALSDALIVYGSHSGELYYNANGAEAGFGSGAQFAVIEGAPTLDASRFVIQA